MRCTIVNRKSLILVIPLLLLFIAPLQSRAYGISEQSILSFAETIPDDVPFYPDALETNTQLATAGSAEGITITGDYTYTHESDDIYYKTSRAGAGNLSMTLNFSHSLNFVDSPTDGAITVEIEYNTVTAQNEKLYLWNFTSGAWDSELSFAVGDGTYNLSLTSDHISSGLTRLKANLTCWTGCFLWFDYANSRVTSYTSNESWVETFADVSDWASPSTDGDVASIEGDAWTHHYTNTPSFTDLDGYYVEYRVKANKSISVRCYAYQADDRGGGYAFYGDLDTISTTWTTIKFHIQTSVGYASDTVESISFSSASNDWTIHLDEIRIGPSTEFGYQHDCANTTLVDSIGGDSFTSNGDLLNLTGDGDGGAYEFLIDNTTTASALDTSYYPFIEVECPYQSYGDSYWLYVYDGSSWTLLSPYGVAPWAEQVGTARYNLKAAGLSEIYKIRINVTQSSRIYFDWVKVYSIANYSYSAHASITKSDFAFVNSSGLCFSRSTAYWMALNHDPSISISSAIHDSCELTTSTITDGGTDDMYFSEYEGGDGDTWFNNSFSFIHTTIDDFAIGSYGDYWISAISFIDTHDWHDSSDLDLLFDLGFSEEQQWGLDILFILAGLVMIPCSTMYLVYGGKEAFNTNKLFFGIVGILVGFGLLAGGIM